jgi:hypothetical protein
MGNTLTIRLPRDLAEWLQETSRKGGLLRGPDRAPGTGACPPVFGQALGASGGCPPRPISPRARVLAQVKAIADTGFLVALANQRGTHDQGARGSPRTSMNRFPTSTSEAVLAEPAFHVAVQFALGFVENRLVRSVLQVADHVPRLRDPIPVSATNVFNNLRRFGVTSGNIRPGLPQPCSSFAGGT